MARLALCASVGVLALGMKTFSDERSAYAAQMGNITNMMVQNLQRSKGYDAVFFRGCLDFVEKQANESIPVVAQVELLGAACKSGSFGGDGGDVLSVVDPSKLASECDRAVRNMDLQTRLLGPDAFRDSSAFCAVFVDLVLPIDAEPKCMRFVEDISLVHAEFSGTQHVWPAIIAQHHFDEAFMRVCLEEKQLKAEEQGHAGLWGAGSDECKMVLERVLAYSWAKYHKLVDFFADACPLMGMTLPLPGNRTFADPLRVTRRAVTASLFHRASHIALAKHGGNVSSPDVSHLFGPSSGFSAMQLMDSTMAKKGSSPRRRRSDPRRRRSRRRRRRMTDEASACCSGKAYSWSHGVEFGAIITITQSGSLTGGGFEKWTPARSGEIEQTCVHKKAAIRESCFNFGFDIGVDYGFAHGWFNKFSDILGTSRIWEFGFCFGICLGGGVIDTGKLGDVIGGTIEFGAGSPSIEGSCGQCEAWLSDGEGSEHTTYFRELKCPSGCFPADAQVMTPAGPKAMHSLRVGDRVLSMDKHGRTFFDDVYFFGHADPKAFTPMVQLRLKSSQSDQHLSLQLSPDHFVHACPRKYPCEWSESRLLYAGEVLPGAFLWTAEGWLAQVLNSSLVPKLGLFNPYTLSGTLVVNGMVVSAHSSWLLDDWVPPRLTEYLPFLYQGIFIGGRWLYHTFGSSAADWIGVNNPHEQTPWLAYLVAIFPCFALLCTAWRFKVQCCRKHPPPLRNNK